MMEFLGAVGNSFSFLYNMVTGALILWVLTVTATASAVRSLAEGRGALWGAMISTVGAVIILLLIQLVGVPEDTINVLNNFIIMTLGGLGSGLLAVALVTKPNAVEALKFKRALFNILDYAFVWLWLSSLSMIFLFLISKLSGRVVATDHALGIMLITFLFTFLSIVVLECRNKFPKWGESVGLGLFLILVVLLVLYVGTLASVWSKAPGWILTLNTLVACSIVSTSLYYRRRGAGPLLQP